MFSIRYLSGSNIPLSVAARGTVERYKSRGYQHHSDVGKFREFPYIVLAKEAPIGRYDYIGVWAKSGKPLDPHQEQDQGGIKRPQE